ncbi:hypothetical protein EVAR_20729_1 [Eumeta japonica]|uniref:Uncharacterized protein n=1 Tax=Eumeta variegata TaxID=151549 RepID=A0A4C1V9H8_EUMVA|nr:hypothetical protein EVAR_20729_1 [Eumeta japonica]
MAVAVALEGHVLTAALKETSGLPSSADIYDNYLIPLPHSFLHQISYSYPRNANALVTPPEPRVSMGCDDHLHFSGSHAHLLLDNGLKKN